MIGKISVILLIFSICSIIDGNRFFLNNDNDLELSNEKAQMFLRSMISDEDSNGYDDTFDKRESGTNCVPCKFKINDCCSPNFCKKHMLWNECVEVVTRKPGPGK